MKQNWIIYRSSTSCPALFMMNLFRLVQQYNILYLARKKTEYGHLFIQCKKIVGFYHIYVYHFSLVLNTFQNRREYNFKNIYLCVVRKPNLPTFNMKPYFFLQMYNGIFANHILLQCDQYNNVVTLLFFFKSIDILKRTFARHATLHP